MSDVIDAPANFDPQPHLVRAFREISNYTAIFILEDGRVGSGVFVNTGGAHGILTAHHVAKPLLNLEHFALNISEREHALWWRSEYFEHIPIASQRDNPNPELGPDLSFIRIGDENSLGILRSLKSFCFLDSQNLMYFDHPLARQMWAVAGSPYESKSIVKPASPNEGPVARMQNWVGRVHFESRTIREGFDYVQLRATSGINNFPASYEGVSGGGFWLVPLEIDADESPDSVSHGKPVLAGIAFYQSEVQNSERILTGHGYESVYGRLRQVLQRA